MMERYSEYKDSGVKWLEEIPSHWEVVRLKNAFLKRISGSWGEEPNRSQRNTICLRIADFEYNRLRFQRKEEYTVRSYTINELDEKKLRNGDLLIEKSGGGEKTPVGRCVVYDLEMQDIMYANFMEKLSPREFVNSYYMCYLLSCLYNQGMIWPYVKATTGIQNLDINSLLAKEYVFLPPKSEQDAIARYLDTATSEIDKAIAMQQKMIDLLNERKQIIIQNAVTKGLDENVEMKESGVEWIGRIPKHWEVVRLSHLTSKIGSGSTPKVGYVESGIIFLRSQNVYCEGLKLNDVVHISANVHRNMSGTKVLPNDVLMNITGGSIGRCFYVDETLGEANVNQHVSIIRPTSIDTHYLKYYLQSYCGQIQVSLEQTGGNREGLTAKALAKFLITYPSQSEQKEIAAYLDSEMQRFDSAITNCQRQITLLQERKQIIINEVVTGKVRVS